MRLTFVLLFGFLMAGCTTIDPYTGEQKTSRSTNGAAIGAVSGAIVGSLLKDSREGILVGALGGAAIGGAIGHSIDKQEAELRKQLRGTGVQVRREGDKIRLVMPGNITFATGRAEIRSDFYSVLDSVSVVMKKFDDTRVLVAGHTDSTGSASLNQTLSEQRAYSVKRYLISRGITSGRINSVGYGPRYPVASNSSERGRQANRRVELELEQIRQARRR